MFPPPCLLPQARAGAWLAPALTLLLPPVGLASEAWLLEMDASLAQSLRSKLESSDETQRREALARLPAIVTSGRIREIERVEEQAGQALPLRNRQRSLICRKEPCKGQTLLLGTTLESPPEMKEERVFRMRTEGEGLGADLYLVTQGKLGSSWQPSLLWTVGEKTRLYLERDPAAPAAQVPQAALLTLKVSGPRVQESVWFLPEGHPLLARAAPARESTPKTSRPLLSLWDTVTRKNGPLDEIVNLGPQYSCSVESAQSLTVELSWNQEAARGKVLFNQALATLSLGDTGTPAQTTYQATDLEHIKEKGTIKPSNPREGTFVASLSRQPAPTSPQR